ncbi:MAG: DUF2202 domain-containing protein [Acidobacteria bacterium]|nr:DUF2202 domain-containing protein [Acidobacteriota bacterium]
MRRLVLIPLVLVALSAGCGSDSSPTAPSPAPIVGPPLAAEVRAAMDAAIVDEYRAETIYAGVVTDLGAFAPFTNVLTAEQRHSASIARLFVNRGLTAPVNPWTLATVPHFATFREACAAGVVAEQENIAIYDRHLGLDLPADVRQVFENNRAVSLLNHLPAFQRCAS